MKWKSNILKPVYSYDGNFNFMECEQELFEIKGGKRNFR